ncbi:MAG: carboxypeptidase-like regulatory domain-containing protein, partial [Vicinamibacterales bacterium]
MTQPLTASIEGRVTDAQRGVLQHAHVTVVGPQGARTSATDSTGAYRLAGLEAGVYEIRIEAAGFKTRVERHVPLGAGVTLVRHVVLEVGGPTETLVVDAPVV